MKTKFKIKVTENLTNQDFNKIYKYNLSKLDWYKSKGWSKELLISEKIFSKSFIIKNF